MQASGSITRSELALEVVFTQDKVLDALLASDDESDADCQVAFRNFGVSDRRAICTCPCFRFQRKTNSKSSRILNLADESLNATRSLKTQDDSPAPIRPLLLFKQR